MTEANVRTRTRTPPATDKGADAPEESKAVARAPRAALARSSTASASEPVEDTSWMKTGADAQSEAEKARAARAAADAEAAKKPYVPMRYKLDYKANNGNGEVGDIIILDSQPGPRFYEHNVRNPRTGYWSEFEACPHEWDNCPLCPPQGEKQPYYVMYLTVLDLRPFESRRDGKTYIASRKLFPVKLDQQPFFDDLVAKHGSLRGVHIICTRDGGSNSAVIGNRHEFDCIHSEEELETFAKENGFWDELKTDNGRLIYGEGEFIQPLKYGVIFERPSAAKLKAKYGGEQAMGGAHEAQGEGWRSGTEPGKAPGSTLARSSRRVNLSEGDSGPEDEIPF